MQTLRIAGLVLAGAALASIPVAMGQTTNLAYGTAPKGEYVVFLDRGGTLSPIASQTVQMAAEAAKSANSVRISGRSDYAQTVKRQLLRDGVPEQAIVVTPTSGNPLPRAADGLTDPMTRRVEIRF